jgi:hypothetical protein
MSDTPKKWRSNILAALTILAIVFVGPSLGLALWALGFAFAPPWTFLTGSIYPLLGCAGLPLGIVAVWAKRLGRWGFLATLGLTPIAAILFLTILGPQGGIPGGMTGCAPLAAPPPQVRYACVSTSSDTDYRYEFTLEGWAGWPVMRIVDAKPLQ